MLCVCLRHSWRKVEFPLSPKSFQKTRNWADKEGIRTLRIHRKMHEELEGSERQLLSWHRWRRSLKPHYRKFWIAGKGREHDSVGSQVVQISNSICSDHEHWAVDQGMRNYRTHFPSPSLLAKHAWMFQPCLIYQALLATSFGYDFLSLIKREAHGITKGTWII